MKTIKYFLEFLFIVILFIIFKVLGLKLSSKLGSFIGKLIGPFFRSEKEITSNIKNALPNISDKNIQIIDKNTLRIFDLPYGTTTANLIDSVVKANNSGKRTVLKK